MTINEILQVVRSEEAQEIHDVIVVVALSVFVALPCVVFLAREIYRRMSVFGLVLMAVCLVAMATKVPVPQITWDTGLYNANSTFDTNTWRTVTFRWTKGSSVVSTEPVYFAKQEKTHPEVEWEDIGQSTAGAGSWSYTFPSGYNATNYNYYVYMLGEVHTNGVWLGNILQKTTPGTSGPDKMVILKGKLNVNGAVIAPFKE